MSKRSRLAVFFAALGALVVIAVVVTVAVRSQSAQAGEHPASYAVAADSDACGAGWGGQDAPTNASVPGGEQTFTVTNHTVAGIEVYLQAVDSKKVFLDLEGLGAGAHATARVTIGAGRYRFVCLPADADPVHGPTVSVGPAPPSAQLTPGVVPVTRNDLIPVAKTYTTWVASRIPVLQRQVAELGTDTAEGDLAAARRDWLSAHLTYETLGAAYDAFGDTGDAIDGLPAPGTTALTDSDLTGFHRIEALLWSGAPATQVADAVSALSASVATLASTIADAEIDPGAIGLRAHEIVENALQFELTGDADAASGTELATVDANLSGASAALAPLTSILSSRYDGMTATTASIAATQKLIESFRAADGSWRPLSSLSRAERERVDGAVDGTLELLAPVAAICDIRREA
ncbi:imelysin family protein [Leifsonia sp. NPDC102414]|uniref:imelysin family protein n=1 Tax=Leifsonia sp. NPDC102414 TaxID=3364124 RepID=UPI00381B1DF8